MLFLLFLLFFFSFYAKIYTKTDLMDSVPSNTSSNNYPRAHQLLFDLCVAYKHGIVSGDLCNRICHQKNWSILDIYEGNKVVIALKDGGQETILKSSHSHIEDFEELDPRINESDFTNALLEIVNYNLRLGWSSHYKRHLVDMLWPIYLRKSHSLMSEADRRSLWALMSQEEYISFRVFPLSRVTPKVIGSCGHFYQVEKLVPFRMKGYYLNLKAKILLHLMGTLKLFDEFLNEPLQWCDIKFDNLGLSADYPKRFMIMDADMLYTTSRMKSILTGRKCVDDDDCKFFDCHARCLNETGSCSDRTNSNLEVFCQKLVHQLFGDFWSKSNHFLAACYDTSLSFEERLADLRLAWSWNLSDV